MAESGKAPAPAEASVRGPENRSRSDAVGSRCANVKSWYWWKMHGGSRGGKQIKGGGVGEEGY